MVEAIQLLGYLILGFLGLVGPILVILLSMFREGMSKLTIQYENEKSQSEKNIKEQLKKLAETDKTDVKEIKQSLKKLEALKKTAETRLSYLNPKKQISRLFIPLFISFLGVIAAILTKTSTYYVVLLIALSSICFAYAIVTLWKLLGIIIEVRKTMADDKSDTNMKIIELLSSLLERQAPYFLKNVSITIDDDAINNKVGEISIGANKKQELKIGISNSESRMVKNIQIGFTFPLSFVIEKTNYYSIYTDKTNQIIRYTTSSIHGKTHLILGPLVITAIKTDDYKINTFINAENIETVNRNFNLKVTETPLAGILTDLLTENMKGKL